MGAGKGGQTTSNQSSSVSIPQSVLANYQNVYGMGQAAASQPFQSYSGEFVAPVNQTQVAGLQQLEAAGSVYQPYTNQAMSTLGQGLTNAGLAYGAAPGAAAPWNSTSGGLI